MAAPVWNWLPQMEHIHFIFMEGWNLCWYESLVTRHFIQFSKVEWEEAIKKAQQSAPSFQHLLATWKNHPVTNGISLTNEGFHKVSGNLHFLMILF